MSILKIWVRWFLAPVMPMYLGGQSSSDSSTTTTANTTNQTTYQDQRNVASDGGVGVSGSGNNVSAADFGSVKASIDMAGGLAEKALNAGAGSVSSAFDSLKASVDANKDIFTQALALVGSNADKTNQAFQTAVDEKNGNRTLVLAGMAVLGFLAIKKGFKT